MRTTAANVAARAAVGGDDMLSKWQLMAEQARQKREGGVDTSGSQPSKDVSRKPLSTSGRKDNQETEKRGNAAPVATSGKCALIWFQFLKLRGWQYAKVNIRFYYHQPRPTDLASKILRILFYY